MANVYGERRDGHEVCHYLGCQELAVWRHGMWIACEEHWKLLELGETEDGRVCISGKAFKIPTPPEPKAGQYVVAKSTATPIDRH